MSTLRMVIHRVKGYLTDIDIDPQLPQPRFEGPIPFAVGEKPDEFQLDMQSCLRKTVDSLIVESKLKSFDRLPKAFTAFSLHFASVFLSPDSNNLQLGCKKRTDKFSAKNYFIHVKCFQVI